MMADLGIEVWLGTFRGGRGSDGHVTLGVDSDHFAMCHYKPDICKDRAWALTHYFTI